MLMPSSAKNSILAIIQKGKYLNRIGFLGESNEEVN